MNMNDKVYELCEPVNVFLAQAAARRQKIRLCVPLVRRNKMINIVDAALDGNIECNFIHHGQKVNRLLVNGGYLVLPNEHGKYLCCSSLKSVDERWFGYFVENITGEVLLVPLEDHIALGKLINIRDRGKNS